MATVHQRYRQTKRDGRTDDLRWQYHALHFVHHVLKIKLMVTADTASLVYGKNETER